MEGLQQLVIIRLVRILLSFNKFQASALITPIEDLQLEQQISFKLQQNPVQQRSIPLEVYAAYEVQGHVQIYALDGQLLLQTAVQQYQAGYTAIHIPASQLSNSIYLAVFTTPKGVFSTKNSPLIGLDNTSESSFCFKGYYLFKNGTSF